ncbi:anaphase-promoting complex subunit Hcn1 [Nowakowskiella sp. JEL0407]|nr:anaphase-promoting complex subunit Hcn1 [Nowakowskiella sp. JEL0407]
MSVPERLKELRAQDSSYHPLNTSFPAVLITSSSANDVCPSTPTRSIENPRIAAMRGSDPRQNQSSHLIPIESPSNPQLIQLKNDKVSDSFGSLRRTKQGRLEIPLARPHVRQHATTDSRSNNWFPSMSAQDFMKSASIGSRITTTASKSGFFHVMPTAEVDKKIEEAIPIENKQRRLSTWDYVRFYMVVGVAQIFFLPVHDKKGAWISDEHLKVIMELEGYDNGIADMQLGIHPYSRFKVVWGLVISVIYITALTATPILASFQNFHDNADKFSVYSSIFYFFDALQHIFTFKLPTDEIPWLHHGKFTEYLKTCFILDLITIPPYELIVPLFTLSEGLQYGVSGLLLLLRMFRAFLIYDRLETNPLWHYTLKLFTQKVVGGRMLIKTARFGLHLFYFMHLYACAIYLVNRLVYFSKADDENDGVFLDTGSDKQYTIAFQLSLRNIFFFNRTGWQPYSVAESWVTMLFMTLGSLTYSGFLGAMEAVCMGSAPSVRIFREKLDEIKEFCHNQNFPKELQHKVEDYFKYKYKGKYINSKAVEQDMNESLRREVAFVTCEPLLAKIDFLRIPDPEKDKLFISLVASVLEEQYYIPGDLILRAGQVVDDMYIIREGFVEFVQGDQVLGSAAEGDFFGESGLLREVGTNVEVSVIAREYSMILVLHKKDFMTILAMYPELVVGGLQITSG